jgi:hypothetical protein
LQAHILNLIDRVVDPVQLFMNLHQHVELLRQIGLAYIDARIQLHFQRRDLALRRRR